MNNVFSFNKSSYPSIKQIEDLYQKKIELTTDEKIIEKLQKALFFDPRRSDIYFSSEVIANNFHTIADKLSQMTEQEFIESDYPFEWLREVQKDSILKITNPSVVSPISSASIMQKVLEILNSSTRSMPAHFTSNGDRMQSFCVDFDIPANDEYEMASYAFRMAENQLLLPTAEDMMLAAYLAVKLGGEEQISELQDIVLKQSDHKKEWYLPEHFEYFQKCVDFGRNVAHKRSTPQQ
jgi:hypothetical protein